VPKQWPPLTYQEVVAILECWGFEQKRQVGSHEQWCKEYKGRPYFVTVDNHHSVYNDPDLIQSMVRQSGLTRQQFYAGCRSSANKINVAPLKYAR